MMKRTAIMKDDARRKDKNHSVGSVNNLLSRLKGDKVEKPRMITVREEKKTLIRIIKAKPKAVAHRSEVLKNKTLTEEEMMITEAVIRNVASAPKQQTVSGPKIGHASPPPKYFVCVECGARVPEGSDVCPKCRARYLFDLSPESIAELERAQSEFPSDDNMIEQHSMESLPVLHFDALDGIMSYLEPDDGNSDFVLECSQCGTLVQLDITHCPMCNTKLEVSDVGIFSLLKDTEFDSEAVSELACPHCGEHVTLEEGVCPACQSVIVDGMASADQNKMIPIISTENVVFVHVDLETGGLNYIQRHMKRLAIEHTSIQLDGIGSTGFDRDWEGLSRI